MRKKTAILCIVVIVVAFFFGGATYKLYKHEAQQNKEMSELLGKVEYLDEKLKQTTDYYNYDTNYSDDSFNYFAIGNSLTMISSWGRGICSTRPDNDYFGLVSSYFREKNKNCVSYAYNFSPWERSSNREETLELLDKFLDEKLNLVTIQLGENVTDTSTYKEDLETLISYVRNKCPKATIIVIGDWWSKEKSEMRRKAASESGVAFADLSEIIGNTDYQSSVGEICYLEDGSTITVNEAAASHPGDKGMQYIADKILEAYKK